MARPWESLIIEYYPGIAKIIIRQTAPAGQSPFTEGQPLMNLDDFILANEVPIRLGFFFGTFAVMAVWELISPRPYLQTSKGIRTFRAERWCSWLPGMLAFPFVGKVQDYAINRRRWEQTREP
jgi:hypothetical protein